MAALRLAPSTVFSCYQCLRATTLFAADRLAEYCNRFAALHVGLERVTDGVFRAKPGTRSLGGVLVGTARRRVGQSCTPEVHCSL